MSKNAGNSNFPDSDFLVEFECSFLIKMQAKTNDLLAIQVSCYCITTLVVEIALLLDRGLNCVFACASR